MQPTPPQQQAEVSALANLTRSIESLTKEARRKTRFGYLKVGAFVAFTSIYLYGASTLMADDAPPSDKNYVAVVKIQGLIADGREASYAALAPAMKAAFEDKRAKGVVLQINSPGGTPVQSSLIHDLVIELKKKHGKRVIAVGEDMVTSGAYFIAVAADEIYVNRSTITGSIGVISAGFGFPGLLEKVGVERRVLTAGESKNTNDAFLPVNINDIAQHTELISDIHTHFKDEVKAGRGARLVVETKGLFEGKVWTGGNAVPLGLVDGLGSLTTVALEKFEATEFKHYGRKKGMESWLSDFGVESAKKVLYEISTPTTQTPQVVY